MKEPQKFIGAKKIILDCSGIWEAIYDLDKRLEEYKRSQTIMNWFWGIALTLSVSALLTMIIFGKL